jgi:hypothetical protein
MTSWRDGDTLRREPKHATTENRPACFGDAIRRQFRQLMERLTRPFGPKPEARKRRSEETRGGFKLAAISLVRIAVRAAHLPPAIWDSLTWLRHWEFDGPDIVRELDHESFRPGDAQDSADLSPRL